MSFINAFQKKYSCGYTFFHSLFPDALKLLQDALIVLDRAIEKGDGSEWMRTMAAVKSIAEDMCFATISKKKFKMKKPNRKDYYILTACVNNIANLR